MSKASIFMTSGWVGLGGLAVAIGAALFAAPDGVTLAGLLLCVFACWAMLFTRNADEYTRGLWTAAASLAFATLLILFLTLPFFEGVYDGYKAAHAGDGVEPQRDIPAILSIGCAIVAFYIGLLVKRLFGDI
jgi:hypothetical protein